jgi:ABC-2 type transport system permease protein
MERFWSTLRHTLRGLVGQILGWGLGVAALGMMIVSMYDSMMSEQGKFIELMENYPPEFLAFFGADTASMLTPEGYLGMYGFSMLPVIVGIFAVMAGGSLIAGDEEHGRLDLILAHPVGRTTFFFGRLLGFYAAALAIMAIAWLGFSLLLGGSSIEISWGQMALPFLPLLVQTLIYGTLALLLSLLLPSGKLAAMVVGLVMVTSYLVSSLSTLNESLSQAAKLLPYAYFQGSTAIHNLNLTWLFSLSGASAIMAGLAWWRFVRRDIRLSGEGSFRLGLLRWKRGAPGKD